jgi:hypothetical protein
MGKQAAQSSEDNKTRRSASSDLDNPQDFGSNADRLSAMKNAHALDKVTSISQMVSVIEERRLPEFYGKEKYITAIKNVQGQVQTKRDDNFGTVNVSDVKLIRSLLDDRLIPEHMSPMVLQLVEEAEAIAEGLPSR